jgi:hypothetical protein
MIQNVIKTLGGIERYGTTSLCLFVLVFTAILIWTFSQRKSHLDHMARVPLETDNDDSKTGGISHE